MALTQRQIFLVRINFWSSREAGEDCTYGWKPDWKHKNFIIWGINANVFSQTNETSNKLKLQKENFIFN